MMSFRGWDKVEITTHSGERHPAIAPVILSASRSTDIPAHQAGQFFDWLRRGYVEWINPFNGRTQLVSLAQARAIVFWTKHARPILPLLPELDERGIGYYFLYTLNDYESEGLEEGLPPLEERVAAFRELARRLGPARVVWRFDPLLLAGSLTVKDLLARVRRVGEQVHGSTEKLVFSFADIRRYPRVVARLKRFRIPWTEFSPAQMADAAGGIAALNRDWGLELATCAEAVDLDTLGIRPNRCIDDRLLRRLFPEDRVLAGFLNPSPAPARTQPREQTPPPDPVARFVRHVLKDRSQRRYCGCIVSKDIGRAGTCGYGCRYCYATAR